MNVTGSMKASALCSMFLLIAGCSASSTNSAGAVPAALLPSLQTARLGPDGSSNDLLYITNYGTSNVEAYDWPSLMHTQTVRGLTHEEGLCADAKGDVFVANTNANDIEEYAHGGTEPIATLKDLPNYDPNSCAVDPISGDLAVANLASGNGSAAGNIVIYKDATGKPKSYDISTIFAYYMCGYDARGNLVVDGFPLHGAAAFAVLQRGSDRLQALTLDNGPRAPGGIQWDGKHWAIGDVGGTIYQFDVTGTNGKKAGTTTLDEHDSSIFGFFISGDRVIAPEHETGNKAGRQALIFKYPAGGAAIGSIQGLNLPFGAVISHGT